MGQEHIVRTLRNAVELDKVHHAYLFVGSRGTGKTSMAKLLACALNAEGGPRTDFSPDDPACRAIADGTSLDVVEMDAASNNSVDDIRELRENVALAPMGGGQPRLHPRRGPHAHHPGLERVPEDARGAAAARRLRPRDHRGSQGAGHDRRPLPPLRLPAAVAAAGRDGPRQGRRAGGDRGSGAGRRDDRAGGHRQLPRRARHARAARHLRRQRREARRRARGPRRGRRRAGARGGGRAGGARSEGRPHRRRAALRLGPRPDAVHARPRRPPPPPLRGADDRRGAGLVLGHRRAHRSPGGAGRPPRAGRGAPRHRPPWRRPQRRQGRLRPSDPARAGAAEGGAAAGRPLAPGADVQDRAARGAARRGLGSGGGSRRPCRRRRGHGGGADRALRRPARQSQPEAPPRPRRELAGGGPAHVGGVQAVGGVHTDRVEPSCRCRSGARRWPAPSSAAGPVAADPAAADGRSPPRSRTGRPLRRSSWIASRRSGRPCWTRSARRT